MNKQDVRNLRKRYLVWLYKTTKEAFDKYERKFTQTDIDKDLLYREYISAKENSCLELKYQGKKTNPEFIFLDLKLNAIEKLITKELGRRGLEKIKAHYEQEMTKRILRSVEH